MTDIDLAAIRARHTGKHRCLGAWRAVSGFRMFGLDDGERCDAARLTDEVERLERVRMDVLTTQREIGRDDERARIHAAVEGLTAHIVGGHEADCDTCIRWSDELQTDVDDRGIPCDLFDRGGVLNRAAVLSAIDGETT